MSKSHFARPGKPGYVDYSAMLCFVNIDGSSLKPQSSEKIFRSKMLIIEMWVKLEASNLSAHLIYVFSYT